MDLVLISQHLSNITNLELNNTLTTNEVLKSYIILETGKSVIC